MQNPINPFKSRLARGTQQLGLWMTLQGSATAEALATCGYDWLLIDTEHAPMELADVLPALQAVAAYPDVAPVVRLVENDTALIKKALDIGAQTLMIPYVQTAEEARAAVAAMRYAPRGLRGSAGATRATRYGLVENYAQIAEEELCLIVQVETIAAMDHLEDIASVDGVDAVFIGPADLACSMGHAGNPSHPEVKAVVLDAMARLKARGVPSGILTLDEAFTTECIAAGTRFTALSIDVMLMVEAARALVSKRRG